MCYTQWVFAVSISKDRSLLQRFLPAPLMTPNPEEKGLQSDPQMLPSPATKAAWDLAPWNIFSREITPCLIPLQGHRLWWAGEKPPPPAWIRLPRRAAGGDISLRSVPSVHRNQAAAPARHNPSWKMKRALRQTKSNAYRSTFSSVTLLMDTDVSKHWFTFISFNTITLWLEIHFSRKPIVLGLI